jgi:ribosomal protein S1
MHNETEIFDWELPNGLVVNEKIKSPDGVKVFCHESYAQSLLALYFGDSGFLNETTKDLSDGGVYDCKIVTLHENDALAQTESGQTIYIDLRKERRDAIKLSIEGLNFNAGENIKARVRSINGSYVGSVVEYFVHTMRAELFEQIKKETSAYRVKVLSVNKGGYIVDLSGVKCFLPGSLAAANKITNFESYIGKEIPVMIEGYVEAKDIFIVSYKKYLNKIMDSKIRELDLTKKYKGYVTGTSDFGVFVEWDSVYTGLIHKTEFQDDLSIRTLNPGTEIEFYVKEIKENNRLTLTLDRPLERNVTLQNLENQIQDGTVESYEAIIKHKRKNGALVEIPALGLMALIPQEKLGKKANGIKSGETVTVIPIDVDIISGKIYVQLSDV